MTSDKAAVNPVAIPVSDWEWYGMAAHFICAADCLFHMATKIGDHLVSTVGDLRLHDRDGARGKRKPIGFDRDYETFVFKAGPTCTCGCGMPTIDGSEIDSEPANDPMTARANHMAMCQKYAALAQLQSDHAAALQAASDRAMLMFNAKNEWRERAVAAERRVVELSELLDEVRCCFTRDDDLPNELLPRIDDALATAKKVD